MGDRVIPSHLPFGETIPGSEAAGENDDGSNTGVEKLHGMTESCLIHEGGAVMVHPCAKHENRIDLAGSVLPVVGEPILGSERVDR